MNRFISSEVFNRTVKAGKEISAFCEMLKDDHTTFDHVRKEYLEILKKYYPEVVKTVIDIRLIDNEMIDVELNSGIYTFAKDESTDKDYRHHIINDICLCNDAEIEIKSGYIDNMSVEPLLHGGYHLVFNV